jgi:trimeric autotransporter adhesin
VECKLKSTLLFKWAPSWFLKPYLIFIFALLNHGLASASSGITYHGKILRPDGVTPVSSASTQFRIQIRTPGTENCLLWEEQQTKDLSGTNGVFSITIADNSEPTLIPNALAFSLERVFSNRTNFSSLTGCSVGTTYNPSTADGRYLSVFFREAPTDPWEQMPSTKVNFVPLALNSVQLEGYQSSEFLKIDPLSSYTTLTAANVNTLVDIIAGTNAQYLKPSSTFSGDVTGTSSTTVVGKIRGTNVVATAPTTGQILKYDGTNWAPAADDTGGSPADSSYTVKGTVQINTDLATSGLFIASGVLALPNVITAGGPTGGAQSVPVITYDQKGRLTAVSTATIDDTTKLPLAGGTMTGPINMGTQNITNVTSVAATNFSGRNLILSDNDTNTVTIKTPTDITADYVLTLPPNDGGAGEALMTDGSGGLSWGSPGSTISVTANQAVVANGTGTGLSSFTCSVNQVMSFDGAGLPVCANVTGAGGFLQDGNSFGAAATLGTNDNFDLNFETNGTTKMTVLAGGNVGIGTTSPSEKLDINGNLNLPTTSSTLGQVKFNGAPFLHFYGSSNAFLGENSGNFTLTGTTNVGFGQNSLAALTSGGSNVAIGGYGALLSNTSGSDNIAIGADSSRVNVGGGSNVAIGSRSLRNTTNSLNTAIGHETLFSNTSGNQNVALGYKAGYTTTTTNANVTGSNNTYIGSDSGPGTATQLDNSMALGSGSRVTASNQVVIGNGAVTQTLLYGNVGIGTTTPQSVLQVNGGIQLADDTAACIAGKAGAMKYVGGNLLFCNGSTWQALGVSGAGLTSLGGQTGSTQTFASGAAGTAPAISSALDVHTLNVPLASSAGVTSGTISKTEYDNFSAAATMATSGTSGGIPYYNSATTVASSGVLAADGVVLGGGAGASPTTTAAGIADQVLRIPGAGGAPAFGAIDLSKAAAVSGVLAVANGGTNSSTALTNGKVMVSSAGAIIEGNASNTAKSNNTFVMRDGSGNIAGALGTFDQLALNGSVSGTVSLNAPSTFTSYSLTLPLDDGTSGQVLTTDGSGVTSWSTALTSTTGFIQDGNSFGAAATLGTNDNFDLNFETNATTKMTVLANGNVGVGTTSPNTTLDLNGALSIRGMAAPAASAAGQGRIYFDSTSNKFRVSENNGAYTDLVIAGGGGSISGLTTGNVPVATSATTLGNSSITESSGKIGIGTASPSGVLHIVGTTPGAGSAPNAITATGAAGAANGGGGGFSFSAGSGTGSGSGGSISAVAGAGGATGTGGTVTITGGDGGSTSGAPGGVTIAGGNGPATSGGGTVGILGGSYNGFGRGSIYLYGSGSITTGAIAFATANGNGIIGSTGSLTTTLGNAAMNGTGGSFTVTAGAGSGTGAGGAITMTAGAGGASNVNGSNVVLNGGAKGGSGSDGNVLLASSRGNVGIGTTAPNTTLDLNGALSIRGITAPADSVAGQGRIYFDSTANKFKVSENNGAYVDLVNSGGGISGLTTGYLPKATSATALGDSVIAESSGKIGIGTTAPNTQFDITGAFSQRGMAAPAVSVAGQGRIYFDSTANKFKVSENNGAFADLVAPSNGITGSGATNAIPRFTAAGVIGDSALVDDGTSITATRSIATTTNPLSGVAAINLATSNTHTLAAVSGSAITISGQSDGGVYNIVIEDTTSRTYTFTGCTNSYFKPANAATTAATRTVYGLLTVKKGANWDCYITWSSGFL